MSRAEHGQGGGSGPDAAVTNVTRNWAKDVRTLVRRSRNLDRSPPSAPGALRQLDRSRMVASPAIPKNSQQQGRFRGTALRRELLDSVRGRTLICAIRQLPEVPRLD